MSQSTAQCEKDMICDLSNVYIDACRVHLEMTGSRLGQSGNPFRKMVWSQLR